MKAYHCLLLLTVGCVIASCRQTARPIQRMPDTLVKRSMFNGIEQVSVITLIANPKQYNGHRVRVTGFLNIEFEGNEIYIHKEDYEESISKNGLWVAMDRDSMQLPEIKRCIRKYVLMEGTFDADNQGHMGMCSGAIKDVTRLEVWTPVLEVLPPRKKGHINFPPNEQKH